MPIPRQQQANLCVGAMAHCRAAEQDAAAFIPDRRAKMRSYASASENAFSYARSSPFKILLLIALAAAVCGAQIVHALEAYDRLNVRSVEVLALVGGDTLQTGSLLELALEDTQEIIVGEVLRIRRIGHDLELEILDRSSNHHFFIELPADGVSEIHK